MDDEEEKFTIIKTVATIIGMGLFVLAIMSGIMFLTSKEWMNEEPRQEINHNNYAIHRSGVA